MRLKEVSQPDAARIMGLVEFLVGRAEDENAEKKISTQAFLNMAKNMGMPMSLSTLIDISQRPPLNNIIKSMNQDEILFKGYEQEPEAAMEPDEAEKTVAKMAQRAAKQVNKGA